jgi:hypothetical protein
MLIIPEKNKKAVLVQQPFSLSSKEGSQEKNSRLDYKPFTESLQSEFSRDGNKNLNQPPPKDVLIPAEDLAAKYFERYLFS